jgi:CrcB protein
MTPSKRLAAFALVFIGAAVGGLARWLIDHAVQVEHAWDIAAINVAGSIALGLLAGWTAERPKPALYAFVGPGLLGGFTTFSGLAAFSWLGPDVAGHVMLLLGTMAAAVAGAAAGWVVGRHWARGGDIAPAAEVVP